MLSIASVLPATLERPATGSATLASGKGEGAQWASLFGATLASTKSTSGTSTSTSSTTNYADLLGQLTSLLQNGTPMATIVDQLAQSIGTSAASLLKGQYSQSDLDRLQNTTTQTIANALSPPSNAPPGTAAQEAAALAARLQNLVETIARDAQNGSGQQNEVAGNLLDASSAKEVPAQQQTNGTASTLDVSSVVRSLLASVISALGAPTVSGAPAVRTTPSSVQSSTAASTPLQLASTQLASQQPTDTLSPPSATTVTSGLLTQATANAVGSQQSITMSNAPDLLARMLVRAAGADAQVNGSAAAAGASASTSQTTPTSLAAKLAAMLAEVDAGAIAAGSSSGNTSTSTDSGHTFGQELAQQMPTGTDAASLIAAPNSNAASQDALQSSTSSGSTVDVNQLIEQMVNGMTMRTLAQGTSEIRLQLQPENLGQVTMRLTVSGNQVSANVVAQNADVGSALVANHQDLARSLSAAGLTLSGFSVDVSGGDAGQDQGKDRTAGFGRRFVVHELNGNASTDASETSNLGPPLLSGSRLELFNSLA